MRIRVLLAALGLATVAAAAAQEYPSKPIRLIVPWTPGAGSDMTARLIAQKLTERWGQQIVVDNRPGATGTLGAGIAAKSVPDGYTLLWGTNATHAIAVHLLPNLPYDQEKDLTPVTRVVSLPHLVVVGPGIQAATLADLITAAKAQPGKIAFGSAGNGSTSHLAGELFKTATGLDLLHVPYKGAGQSIQDVLGGVVQVAFDPTLTLIGHIKGGKVKPLAVMGRKRIPALAEVPTVGEAGAPGAEQVTWFGLFGPGGLPAPIVARLHGEIAKIVQLPDVRATFDSLGADESVSASPAEFAAMVRSDVAKYGQLARAANLKRD
jgi:tripartite-type tricarboxylate transporter receptor subunit TctC